MKKQDYILLVILAGFMMAWGPLYQKFFPQPPAPTPEELAAIELANKTADQSVAESTAPAEWREADTTAVDPALTPVDGVVSPVKSDPSESESSVPEATEVLENDKVALTWSSKGATITEVTFKEYPLRKKDKTVPVHMDLSDLPALSYQDLPGINRQTDFTISREGDNARVVFTARAENGLVLRRYVEMSTNYLLSVVDEIENASAAEIELKEFGLQLAGMYDLPEDPVMRGINNLGVDSYFDSEKVKHWDKDLVKEFKKERTRKGTFAFPNMVDVLPDQERLPVRWISSKNRYFVQILTPSEGGEYFRMQALRKISDKEKSNPQAKVKAVELQQVASSIYFPGQKIAPGTKLMRDMDFYFGPKKHGELQSLVMHQTDVMQLGFFSPLGKILLTVLNWLKAHVPPFNYGISIILLTILIKMVFWPLTVKSTKSMRRMSSLSPLMKEITEKYKDNPSKKQQAMMALYKEHKVNPMGGCLPMIIQIPVFFALFIILRNSIELRFTPFLWISDLSQPEGLFKDLIPMGVNFLPLAMAGSMFAQQKLTPTSADPQQQKIMAFMPIMMLFILYNFPSGLALYWTTQNLLSILQMKLLKKDEDPIPQSVAAAANQKKEAASVFREKEKAKVKEPA